MPTRPRLAVLIDADNVAPRHAANLLSEVSKYGVATVKRAYGDWTKPQLAGWKQSLHAHAIHPVQQFAYTIGKGATDSALIIDAMDLLYSGALDGFALVSSDSDFTRLATRLRESAMSVYGFGERKTPQAFVQACEKFVYVELLLSEESPGSQSHPRAADETTAANDGQGAPQQLEHLLRTAIMATSNEENWASLSAVGSHLSAQDPSFDPRIHGFPKLSGLVRAQAFLDVEQAAGGVRVRLKSARPPKALGRRQA